MGCQLPPLCRVMCQTRYTEKTRARDLRNIYTHTCWHTYLHVIAIRTYTHTYVYIHTYIHTHVHPYAHAHRQKTIRSRTYGECIHTYRNKNMQPCQVHTGTGTLIHQRTQMLSDTQTAARACTHTNNLELPTYSISSPLVLGILLLLFLPLCLCSRIRQSSDRSSGCIGEPSGLKYQRKRLGQKPSSNLYSRNPRSQPSAEISASARDGMYETEGFSALPCARVLSESSA